MIFDDFGYPVCALWFYCSQNIKLFGFPIIRYLMVIQETCRVHQISYLHFY